MFSQPVCLFVYSGQIFFPQASRCFKLPVLEINMLAVDPINAIVVGVPPSLARSGNTAEML